MVELVTSNKSPEVFEPADGTLNLPPAFVSSEFATILSRLFDAGLSMRRNKVDASFFEAGSQRIAVCRSVIDQTSWSTTNDALLQQRFDQRDFVRTRTFDHCAARQTAAIDQHHDLGSLARFGFAYAKAPFLAGENVPSAIDSSRSTLPCRSSLLTRRAQARRNTPDSVHFFSRRQHVGYDGKCFGKSFQRAPVRSTQAMASKHARAEARGRPPSGDGGGSSNKSETKPHWSSVSSNSGSILDPTWDSASAEWDRFDISLFLSQTVRMQSQFGLT